VVEGERGRRIESMRMRMEAARSHLRLSKPGTSLANGRFRLRTNHHVAERPIWSSDCWFEAPAGPEPLFSRGKLTGAAASISMGS
jgi:hypothetical protein